MTTIHTVGHFFASAAEKLGAVIHFLKAHQTQIDTGVATASAIGSIIDPELAPLLSQVPRIEKAVQGEVYAILDAGESAMGQPLNVTLDATLADELRAAWPNIKKLMALSGAETKVPAALLPAASK